MPAAKLGDDIAEIQRQMAQIRHDMHHEVQGAVRGAQILTDWRNLIRSYPWISISAATVAGYAIVPTRRSTYPGAAAASSLSSELPAASVMAPPVRQKRRVGWSILGTTFSLLAPVAVRAAQNYALGYLEQWLSQHPVPPGPTSSPDELERYRGQPARKSSAERPGGYR